MLKEACKTAISSLRGSLGGNDVMVHPSVFILSIRIFVHRIFCKALKTDTAISIIFWILDEIKDTIPTSFGNAQDS